MEGNSEADPLAGGIAEATHLRVTVRLANSWGSFVDVSPSTDAWGNSFGCPQADVGGRSQFDSCLRRFRSYLPISISVPPFGVGKRNGAVS